MDTDRAGAVEQWGVFELALQGPHADNPFRDVTLRVTFRRGGRTVTADGFHDGGQVWKARCMPDLPGAWEWRTESTAPEMDGRSGTFVCALPSSGNHGPVLPTDTWHFAYADGKPFVQMGTTCYAWTHQGDALEEETLRTLRSSPFNKIRMCVFPKHYLFNANEPPRHLFAPAPGGGLDFSRPDPESFRHFEGRVRELRAAGIEADLILFHPYDRWGYANMGAENDDAYIRHVVARLAAFRNVWWSLANEYDLMESKHAADWDRFFRIIQSADPYGHLRSIHNCRGFYDHAKPWVTHASIQHGELARVTEWRTAYAKPIVVDECCYEGNISRNWGSITAREMVHRFWEGTIRGGWVGHGETYLHPEEILWWSKGGVLRGESPTRIGFLRAILEEAPPFLSFTDRFGRAYPALHHGEEYYLIYVGIRQPAVFELPLPEGKSYTAEVIDTWEMRAEPVPGVFRGATTVPMPGRAFMALRVRAVAG